MKSENTTSITDFFKCTLQSKWLVLSIFSILAIFVCVLCCEHFFQPVFSQQTSHSVSAVENAEADALYREMLSAIESAISISTSIRQQLRLFNQDFNISGSYHELKTLELRKDKATRFRLDLQMQSPADEATANGPNTLTIVCDNAHQYIYRFMSIEGEKKLESINIKQLTEAIEKEGRQDLPIEVGSMLGLGGIGGMLRSIRNQYDFHSPPVQTQISEKSGSIRVWKIRGRLKPEVFSAMTMNAEGKPKSLPYQIPLAIDIYIGIEDRFPFRFDYFQVADETGEIGERYGYLLFYNRILHDRNISEANFDYQPSDNILSIDITDQVISRMLKYAQ